MEAVVAKCDEPTGLEMDLARFAPTGDAGESAEAKAALEKKAKAAQSALKK
jgi:hypothetical protein